MEGIELEVQQWNLAPFVGFEHPLLTINVHTVVHTWIMLGILLGTLLIFRRILLGKQNIARHIALTFTSYFVNMLNQAMPAFSFTHFCFITSIFCFIFLCNTLSLVPYLDEPTTDLNTTLALGIISFLYTQIATIHRHGLWDYVKGYFDPFFVMLPLNVIGKFATVISISFRLFGNIFGGSIITSIYFGVIKRSIIFEILGIITGLNFGILFFFNLFEGFLQAFVFAMLSLTYLSISLAGEGH